MTVPPDLEDKKFRLETRERDRPLSFHWKVNADVIRAAGVHPSGNRKLDAARTSILVEAALAHDEGRWVSYSRSRAFYTGERRYHGTAFTFTNVTAAIDDLKAKGFIEEERALPGGRGWQSRFRATEALIEALATAAFEFELKGLIRLKNADGELIDFAETDRTLRMHREMIEINGFIGEIDLQLDAADVIRTKHHLLVDGAHYRPTTPTLYRVFNRASFTKGGRAYGWWQSLSKERRRQLLLNGELVAEPDFTQMHPAILYAQRGSRLEGDAYETGEFPRQDGKLAFNVALNAKSRQGAISALRNKADWKWSAQQTSRLIDALKRRNAPIAADLHSDKGVRLMQIDSEITLRAVKGCMRADIPVLPIHDSPCSRQHDTRAGLPRSWRRVPRSRLRP